MSRNDKLTYFIQKLDGKPPEPEYDYRAGHSKTIDEFWLNASAGRYTVEIKRIPKEKTRKQVKTIFGLMINDTIAQANEHSIDVSSLLKYLLVDRIPKGQGLTKNFLLELAYIICPTNDDDGRRITLSKMNTWQASKLFESYRNILAPLGIVIADPDPDWEKNRIENRKIGDEK